MNADDHICFGCGRPISSGQPHIHIGLDDWGQREELASLGLGDDDFFFPFCEPCTTESRNGWQLETHAINEPEGAEP
jgi:hypothetical protein